MSSLEPDFAALVRAHTPQLLGVARAFAQGDEEAEDLLQETWLVAHRDLATRPPQAPVGDWFFDDFLHKPINPSDLLDAVHHVAPSNDEDGVAVVLAGIFDL